MDSASDTTIDPFLSLITDSSTLPLYQRLCMFQREVNISHFSNYHNYKIIDYLRLAWKLLINESSNDSSSIRLASYRATGAFLTRITPFYPEMMHVSFSDVCLLSTIDVKSSAIIASSFAFISNYLAPPFLQKFLKSTPVVHHFACDNQVFAEHLEVIIKQLGHLGIDWLKNLLMYLLNKLDEEIESRYLIKSIVVIIGHHPKLFINIILDFTNKNLKKFIGLISYITMNRKNELLDVDLSNIAFEALDIINSNQSSHAEIDSSLQILAFSSVSFNVQFEKINDDTCCLKVYNDNKSKSSEIPIGKLITKPSFYLLHLPLEFLVPNENDSLMILNCKFDSLATHDKLNVLDVFEIFEKFSKAEYINYTSSVFDGFGLIINKFLDEIPIERIGSVIRNYLYSKQVSWFHSFGKLKVVQKLNIDLFKQNFGENSFLELVNFVFDLCFCENIQLSNYAMETIHLILPENGFNMLLKLNLQKCDFFNPQKIYQSVKLMELFIKKKYLKLPEFKAYSELLMESLFLFTGNLNIISEILKFFSLSNVHNDHLTDIAYSIFKSSYELVSGNKTNLDFKTNSYEFYHPILSVDILNRNVDMITESIDYKGFIEPMHSALLYIFSLPVSDINISIANLSHQLFPNECSNYFYNNWEILSDDQRLITLSTINIFLHYVGDEKVHEKWCKISMKEKAFLVDERYETSKEFLKLISLYHIKNYPYNQDIDLYATFCYYLYIVDPKSIDIKECLNEMNSEYRIKFIHSYDLLEKIIKENYSEFYVDMVENKEKTTIIQKEVFPKEIQDDKIQELAIKYIQNQEGILLSCLLSLIQKRNITIQTKGIVIPDSIIGVIAKYNIIDLSIEDALNLSLSNWREISISTISKNQNKLMELLLKYEKVKKQSLICLCSLIGIINFDENLLMKLAISVLKSANTQHRFYVVLPFLAKIFSSFKKIQSSDVTNIISILDSKFNLLSDQVSSILLIFAQKSPVDKNMVQFIKKCFLFCGKKSTSFGRLHQILIGISSNSSLVGRNYSIQLPSLILDFLESATPSEYSIGLRLLEQSNLSIPASKLSVIYNQGIEIISNRYLSFISFPTIIEDSYRAIMSLLIKKDASIYQHQLLRYVPFNFNVDQSQAAYIKSVSILPISIKLSSGDLAKQIYLNSENCFYKSQTLQIGIKCLSNWIQKIDSNEKETTIINCLLIWIKKNETDLSINIVSEVKAWTEYLKAQLSAKRVFELLCFQFLKFLPFYSVFPTILSFYHNHKKEEQEKFKNIVSITKELCSNKCHKAALENITKLSEYKKLLQLSQFDHDCQESNIILSQF